MRKRVVYALSQEGSEQAIGAMLDAAREPDVATHVVALLVDQPAARFLPILRRREQVEQDAEALAVYTQLRNQIEERLSRRLSTFAVLRHLDHRWSLYFLYLVVHLLVTAFGNLELAQARAQIGQIRDDP